MANKFKFLAVIAAVATLSACGDTDIERAATGGAIGGAAAAATGQDLRKGVLFGAAAGAVSCTVAPGATNCY
jgi:osmotically inducible lipoprotein OsmB